MHPFRQKIPPTSLDPEDSKDSQHQKGSSSKGPSTLKTSKAERPTAQFRKRRCPKFLSLSEDYENTEKEKVQILRLPLLRYRTRVARIQDTMLKWTIGPEVRRRRDPNSHKRRKLSFINGQVDERSTYSSSESPSGRANEVKSPNDPLPITSQRLHSITPQHRSNGESESESKSLFYMSLDHLPLAIVKQYERMIQETENTQNLPPELKSDKFQTKSEFSSKSEIPEMIQSGESQPTRIKEAVHRPLKVANKKPGILRSTQRYSDTDSDSSSNTSSNSETLNWKPTHEQGGGNFSTIKKSILKRSPTTPGGSAIKARKNSNRDTQKIQLLNSTNNGDKNIHDRTDPDFLTTSPGKSTEKKLSLKRHELRKLEKLRSESEKLNRFLRKYYNDCLPKLPPEDEMECSPEEKTLSVFLGQLAKSIVLWNKGLEQSDSTSSTTTSDYEGPSTLPVITEDTEGSSDSGGKPIGLHGIQIPQRCDPIAVLSKAELEVMKAAAFDPPPPCEVAPASNTSTYVSDTYNYKEDKEPSCLNSTPKRSRRKVLATRRKTPKSASTKGGEVLVRSYRNGNYVTLHVVQARNLQPIQHSTSTTPSKSKLPTSWKLSFKISLLGDSDSVEEKVEASSWVKVNRGQNRVVIDQKFSFDASGVDLGESEGKVKVFISFWRRLEKGSMKQSSLVGWTRTELGEDEQNWLPLRREKMRRQPIKANFPEAALTDDLTVQDPEVIQNSFTQATMDSGVEDCGSEQFNNGSVTSSTQISTSAQLVVTLQKEPPESGFGFSVIWSSPPQIGRVTEGKAAERAGLRRGDLISRVNGHDIGHLQREIVIEKMKSLGEILELDVVRDDLEFEPPCHHHHHHCCCMSARTHSFHQAEQCSLVCACKPVSYCHAGFKSLPPMPPPTSILKPPPPPLPLDDWHHSGKNIWKIQFKAGVGQGTLV